MSTALTAQLTKNEIMVVMTGGVTVNPEEVVIIAVSDETSDLTVGQKKVSLKFPFSYALKNVELFVNTAPVGDDIVVDIRHESGDISVFNVRPQVDDGTRFSAESMTPFQFDDDVTVFDNSSVLLIDIVSVGSTAAGKGLKATLVINKL